MPGYGGHAPSEAGAVPGQRCAAGERGVLGEGRAAGQRVGALGVAGGRLLGHRLVAWGQHRGYDDISYLTDPV